MTKEKLWLPHIHYDGELDLALGSSRKARYFKNTRLLWSELLRRLGHTQRTMERFEEYLLMSKEVQGDIKDVGGFVGGILREGKRKVSHVTSRQLITLDADFAPDNFYEELGEKLDCAFCLYSTHKHQLTSPRYRLLIPLQEPVEAPIYESLAACIGEIIGQSYFDQTSYQASRMMYFPSTSQDGIYFFNYQDKPWLDGQHLLQRQASSCTSQVRSNIGQRSLHISKEEESLLKEKYNAPSQCPGLVGAFCRTYSVSEAIEKFLSHIYRPTKEPNRYTYILGSTEGGLVIYEDDQYAYSFHSTDPAAGKLHHAFALVALHLFGEENKSEMYRWVLTDRRVSETLEREQYQVALAAFQNEFDSLGPLIGGSKTVETSEEVERAVLKEDLGGKTRWSKVYRLGDKKLLEVEDWRSHLTINNRGRYQATLDNITLILCNDPLLKKKIAYDLFNNMPVVLGKLPWQRLEGDIEWRDSDDCFLRHYLEHHYGIVAPSKVYDATTMVQDLYSFHPIKEYLEGIVWDQTPRLERLFIDFLGVKEEVYAYEVTKKALVAAVARIYKPAVKFDTMLVLTGEQGVGKSRMLDQLGREWYSDTLTTMIGKEAYEQLQGVWIMEVAEMAATQRASTEAMKHFISKRKDKYREAYGRRVRNYNRQCIFIGTTNNYEFLTDQTGNRRFWPLKGGVVPPTKDIIKDFTKDYVDQVWAEAKYYYEQGEELYLDNELEKIAAQKQAIHTEEDVKEGMIQAFLEMKLPKGWDNMSLNLRREYTQSYRRQQEEGIYRREKVCALEIWCELMGGEIKNLNQIQTRQINKVIESIPKWERGGVLRFSAPYGSQRGFILKDEV